MSSIGDTNGALASNEPNITDKCQPVYPDGTPIDWDGNDAHIPGALYECGRFYKRTGIFQTFFEHHAVQLSNGKLALDSVNAVQFILEGLSDPHSFEKPCPPTDKRRAVYDAEVVLPASPLHKQPASKDITTLSDEYKSSVIIAPIFQPGGHCTNCNLLALLGELA